MVNRYVKTAVAGLAGLVLYNSSVQSAYCAPKEQVSQIINYIMENGERASVASLDSRQGGTPYILKLDEKFEGFTKDIGFAKGFDQVLSPTQINQSYHYKSEIIVQTAKSDVGNPGGLIMMLFDRYLLPNFFRLNEHGSNVYELLRVKSLWDKGGDGELNMATVIDYFKRQNKNSQVENLNPKSLSGDRFLIAQNFYDWLVELIYKNLQKRGVIK